MNASAAGGLADSPWPMFRQNLNHTGVSPYDTSANNGLLKWTFSTGDIIFSSPTIGSDGTIYVGSSDNNLYAINPDGTEKWNFTTGDIILRSSPAIGFDGTIYVGSYDDNLYSINPDGTEKWNFTTNNNVNPSPAIDSDGTIYVGSSDKNLYAINPDGTEKWIFATGATVYSSPTIGSDGTIYVGSGDYKIYAVNPDGTEKWNLTTGNAVVSSSAIGSDGTIYVGSTDYNLYAINPDGSEKWNFTTGDFIFYSSPAIGSEGTIYIGSQDYKLYAINPDGTEKWNYETGHVVLSSPAIGFDGMIYVGSYDGKLHAIGNASAPPTLYINVSQDKENVTLYWDPPSTPDIDHYLIYRSASQTDFDFNTVWVNTSADNESGELGPISLRTMWNDTKAARPGDPNFQKEYYYIIRGVNIFGRISTTSRTVGKWTKTFPQGVSTFSLPLESLGSFDTEWYTSNMNAEYIKFMNTTTHKWMQHNFGDGNTNNTQMKLGEGYEVKFNNQTNYTFTGMPGAMIMYDDDNGFLGFEFDSDAKNLTAKVDSVAGNVTLTWDQPSTMDGDDSYEVYRSTTRDGFDTGTTVLLDTLPYGNETYDDPGVILSPGQYYYMIIPVNETGFRGSSTYSIGIWTEEYLFGYDTIGIPLKIISNATADWYCNNIPETVGINYYIHIQQRWGWHSTRMPEGAFDVDVVRAEGYQISTSNTTKFIFIGV
jgi:outer membrane protein assembly factor BamB